MVTGWVGMVTALLTLLSAALGWAAKIKEHHDANQGADNTQEFRRALAADNGAAADALAADQHDRVLDALGGSAGRRDGDGEEEHY